MNLESFYMAKDIANKTNWQPTELAKIFSNLISHRELIFKMDKELKMLITQNSKNPIKKSCIELNGYCTTEESQMTEKHLEMFKVLVIREMQAKNDPEILPYTNQNG